MTRLSKFLIMWLGVLLVLAACSSAETNLTAESTENTEGSEEIVMAESTSSEQPVSLTTEPAPTVSPPDSPTAQPAAEQPPTPEPIKADFPNLGVAPEIENEVWLNTDEPVTLASQRGKVVLLEFWTFG
jgi:cytoskeletal protein RodZ